MDQIYPDRFAFNTAYMIVMDILIANLISGILIDGFGSLKEADAERNDDKSKMCYICAMTKANVIFILLRWKNKGLPSKNILINTSFGIIYSTNMLSISKTPVISQDFNAAFLIN